MPESERRTVRPYLGVSRCQEAFDRVVLRVGAETCENEASIVRDQVAETRHGIPSPSVCMRTWPQLRVGC